MTELRCADASEAAGEAIAATAVTVTSWLLVEVRGTWPRDVSDFLAQGGPGTAAIRAWLDATPSSRLLFVRRPGGRPASLRAFVVDAGERETSVRKLELAGLSDIDAMDLARDGESADEPLVLVCGHGTRDACCALRGNAVYAALAPQLGPDALWLSSHQAGHRFAANVLVLPQGIQLGRVGVEDAAELVDRAGRGVIALDHYRGRTAYATRAQAADIAVRIETGLDRLDDLVLVSDDGEHVHLQARDGRAFIAAVEEVAGPSVPASCGADPEPQRGLVARIVASSPAAAAGLAREVS